MFKKSRHRNMLESLPSPLHYPNYCGRIMPTTIHHVPLLPNPAERFGKETRNHKVELTREETLLHIFELWKHRL